MRITIWYRPATPRPSVFLHAWDKDGTIWDLAGTLAPDGVTFSFILAGTTEDQRDVSFLYRFGPSDWEANTWTRTVPTTTATELWTEDYSARCALAAPGPAAVFPSVTLHAICEQRFAGGAVYAWTPAIGGALHYQTQRKDAAQTSTFIVDLQAGLEAGFYFKLVGSGGNPAFSDFENDSMIRFWQPSDGPEIWLVRDQVQVQSQAIVPLELEIDFFFPLVLGTPLLHIQDRIGEFDHTVNGSAPVALDVVFGRSTYQVSVYSGSTYTVGWSTEPGKLARPFRIPDATATGKSYAVNGYDHWLNGAPNINGTIDLVIHPNPGSTFGPSVAVDIGIGAAAAHQTIQAARSAGGTTWAANISTFIGVPFWATLVGESRPDGPLDFKRGLMGQAAAIELHTIDGVGGASAQSPGGFADVAPATRAALMTTVYGSQIVNAGVFDPWELPHGVTRMAGQTYFVVRAPHAVRCSVLLMAPDIAANTPRVVNTIPMQLTYDLRYWWVAMPQAQAAAGALYRFAYSDGRELLAPAGKFGEALDPATREAFDTGSLVVDAGSGTEQSWSIVTYIDNLSAPLTGDTWETAGWNWLTIYELHAQRFTQRNAGAATDFDQVITELQTGYLSRLPVTALEFLPLHEFPANQAGWGYNPALFFAIDSLYGGTTAFARLVRAAHDAGRGLILDLVYNHLVGSPLQVLARDVYVSGETAWGDMVYFAHPAACEFFRQATVYLLKTFHLDGFRFDSTETIINGDHFTSNSTPYVIARAPDGSYEFGAGKGWEFLGLLKTALQKASDACGWGWPYLVGENDPENPGMTDPATGVMDGQWHFQAMYALNSAALNTDDHAGDVRSGLDSSGRPFQRSVIYAESHDSVSGQGSTKRIAATEQWGFGMQMAKAVGALTLLAEGIPMIFMGQEAGEVQPFTFGAQPADPGFTLPLNNYETAGGQNLQVLTWFRDLLGLRKNPANNLGGNENQTTGYGYKTVSFSLGTEFFVIVTFGTNTTQQNLSWLNLPSNITYKEIFNSTWPQYAVAGEVGVSNGGYAAQLRSSDNISLPSIGAIILQS